MRFPRLQQHHAVFLVCVVGIFITVFDTSSSIVALPTIAHEFGTDLLTAQWVIAGNGLTIAALLVPMGRLSDNVGRKRIYVVGALIFALGALAASWAGSIYGLIGARVAVGIGSAMTQATSTAIIVGSFSAGERAKMLGLQLGAVGLGSIVGPATGGIVVGTVGWRMLFAITAAAMLAITLIAQRTLRRREQPRRTDQAPFDVAGALLLSTFLVVLLLTLTLGPALGWLAPITVTGAIAAALLVTGFVVHERRSPAPMLDLRLFRRPDFAFGALGAFVVFMGISAIRFLVPFFLQGVRGYTAATVGLLIVPAALVTATIAPFAGRLADRWGVRLFANIGLGITALGFAVFIGLHVATPVWVLVAGLMVTSFGMAIFGAANSASIMNVVDTDSHGATAGFVNLCRNSGNVVGVTFATVVVTLAMAAGGYPGSLAAVDPAADPGVFTAFATGFHRAASALTAIAFLVLAIVLGWSLRARARAGNATSA
ncbi:MAG TPA: MFS transporter [Gammaproteobacteria bacterium]|nr:MFS transporter [Gammaproteobacteria bacterium]